MRELKDGLSGFMRVRNGAQFLEASIESCIDALDELIVVYNDCTDDTQKILEKKKQEHPNKLKIYSFNHNVLCRNLSEDEFNMAISLPENSTRLHSTQCNYALSKVSYKYAMKIDDDQLYFHDQLKYWRNICHKEIVKINIIEKIIGKVGVLYISLYRKLSSKIGWPQIWMVPKWLMSILRDSYQKYAAYSLVQSNASISLSGINVFHDDDWYVTFDNHYINPPYNGEGDHLIFKVSDKTYFTRYYSLSDKTSVIEMFHQPYRFMFATHPMWFHLHANKHHSFTNVKSVQDKHPEMFVTFNEFQNMNYWQVLKKMSIKVNTLYQMILFALIHQWSCKEVDKELYILNKFKRNYIDIK